MTTTRRSNINKTILQKGVQAEEKVKYLNKLLFDTYMVLDHGTAEERLAILEKLENHFSKGGGSPRL